MKKKDKENANVETNESIEQYEAHFYFLKGCFGEKKLSF